MKTIEELLVCYVERHLQDGFRLQAAELCAEQPELSDELVEKIHAYHQLDAHFGDVPDPEAPPEAAMPEFSGYRTIERIGAGGGGDVFKLVDIELGRTVAAKVLRRDSELGASAADFLREARSMALFEDPRIVRLYEVRSSEDPPVLVMEYVDGFELGAIGTSLEYRQRARVIREVADAIAGAHDRGIQHRDLKPSNILLDRQLTPRILDFGLSRGEGESGHGRGTLGYMAPEQLDPEQVIDERSDVYALGIVLYELLCGRRAYEGENEDQIIAAIRAGNPALPAEVCSGIPDALQTVALKAIALNPRDRYQSARDMVADLDRFLEGRPVLAPPAFQQGALAPRVRTHMEHIGEWLRLRLIFRHEADQLAHVYARLGTREDDWIVHGRRLSLSQISLYLGAFLLLCGSLLFFYAYAIEAVSGLFRPLVTLGLPFVGLNVVALILLHRERRAVAVAFFLGAAVVLPLLLLMVMREGELFGVAAQDGQLFVDGWLTNRQLQISFLGSTLWAIWLAFRTRTTALATASTAFFVFFHLSLLADFGLRSWIEQGKWDHLAAALIPLMVVLFAIGLLLEKHGRGFFAYPIFYSAAGLFVIVLELLALNGRMMALFGVSFAPLQGSQISNPLLLDTLITMGLNGGLIYLAGHLLERHGTALLGGAARFLLIVSPFLMLEPMFYLNSVAEYSLRFNWFYLILALVIVMLSHVRQSRSFYFAGLINTGTALWLITDRYQWFDHPWWASAIIVCGLVVLALGFGLERRERESR